ncbi:MAG: glycosyltransferase family 4 protein [Porticoccaceae bacterium]
MSDCASLRVLFLTRYPVLGASSRYRVYQYIPHLEAMGIFCEIQPFMDEDLYQLSFSPGRTFAKIRKTLLATVRRLLALRYYSRFDVIYMQRELLPFGAPWLERWLKRRGARLVFDYDDALFIGKPSRFNPIASLLRAPGKVRELFSLVDLVVAGNNWLRDQARAHGGNGVTLEVAEDVSRFPDCLQSRRQPLVIGWLGSTSTVKYLREIEPALCDLAQRYPQLKFELMGGGDFQMEGVPWTLLPWSLQGEVEALSRWRIGLMPLPEEDWVKGKSGGKARTYMAAGVVPVCTAIGYNLELIEHGRTGFLCRTNDEWRTAMECLIADTKLCIEIGQAARAEVEKRFSPAVIAAKMAALLFEVADGRFGLEAKR